MNWDQVANHSYLSLDKGEEIDLDILFEDNGEGEGPTQRNNKLIINTKDPSFFNRVYAKASQKYMEKNQDKINQNENELLNDAGGDFAAGVKIGAEGIIDQNAVDESQK